MKRISIVLAVLLVLSVVFTVVSGPLLGRSGMPSAGLNTRSDFYSYDGEEAQGVGGGAPAPMEPMATAAFFDRDQAVSNENLNQVPQKRLVIKNADLTIVVKDPVGKMQSISTMAESMGGFVVSSSTGESYLSDGITKVPEGSIVIRIPAEKLEEALKEIKAEAVEVRNETQSGQDVTKEYTDVQSQLKNLEATEKKLTEIMDEATRTEDVLAVFNQLTQIRGQIEVLKGQMQYYEQAAALSAVSVRLIADRATQPIEIAGWQPQGEARDAVQALVDFFQNFVSFLIWLAIFFIPVAAVLLLLIALLWRLGKWLWKKFSPKQSTAE